jgi:hypothetical protein
MEKEESNLELDEDIKNPKIKRIVVDKIKKISIGKVKKITIG